MPTVLGYVNIVGHFLFSNLELYAQGFDPMSKRSTVHLGVYCELEKPCLFGPDRRDVDEISYKRSSKSGMPGLNTMTAFST
jgi:hypothetical protein